ncbi:MAG: isoamylase early set domain-containing protein [Anaerolineae bacterium]
MLKKQYLKTKPVCKVTFYTPEEIDAEAVYLVGDFNDWDEQATPMEKLKDGRFKAVLPLEVDQTEYQFRYLVNGAEWLNDWEADKYVPNPFLGDNSVVVVSE